MRRVLQAAVAAGCVLAMVYGCTNSSGSSSAATGSSGSPSSSSTSTSTSTSTSSSGNTGDGGMSDLSIGASAPGHPHTDIPDNTEVLAVFGPQGSYNLWLSVSVPQGASWLPSMQPELRYTMTRQSTNVGQGGAIAGLHTEGTSTLLEDSGIIMFFDFSLSAADWNREIIQVDVEVVDSNQNVVKTAHRTWQITCCSEGFGGGTRGDGGVGNGGPDAGPHDQTPSCPEFCDVATVACTNGTPPMYASRTACIGACELFPAGGVVGYGAGDTLQCRAFYADRAREDLGACTRLADDIETLCTDTCGYYCRLMLRNCPGAAQSQAGCLVECGGFVSEGTRGDTTGESRACFIHYAEASDCEEAAPLTTTACE